MDDGGRRRGTGTPWISSDVWNARRVDDVLTLRVVNGHYNDSGSYALRLSVNGIDKTIYADDIAPTARKLLSPGTWTPGPAAMAQIESALERALDPAPTPRGSARSSKYPSAGQLRPANLYIEGEGLKPAVVLSGHQYGSDLDFAFVIVCRKGSNSAKGRDFEVPLKSQVGAVVCSHITTVDVDDLRDWTASAGSITPRELAEVRSKARLMLGST